MEKPRINSMFITNSQQDKPILSTTIKDDGIEVDLHIQFINFTMSKHKFMVSVKDKNGHEYLDGKPNNYDFSGVETIPDESHSSIGEVVMFIKMTKEETTGINYIIIRVKIDDDDELEGTIILYLNRGEA